MEKISVEYGLQSEQMTISSEPSKQLEVIEFYDSKKEDESANKIEKGSPGLLAGLCPCIALPCMCFCPGFIWIPIFTIC